MSKSTKTVLWAVAAGVLVIAFVITGTRRLRRETVESIAQIQERLGVPVDVVTARVAVVEDWREFTGIAQGIEQVDLISDYRSRVTEVRAQVGAEVRKGAIIVSLDPLDPVRFGTNLQTLEASYRTARNDSIRIEELYKTGAVSVQDLDRVRTATQAARSAYVMSGRAVRLDTPISGVVTATYVNPGDYADAGQVVATVASFDRIRVPLTVSASERTSIEAGQPVRIRLRGPGLVNRSCSPGSMAVDSAAVNDEVTLTGTVTKAALSTDASSRLFSVEVVVQNTDRRLKPGMLVSPEILVAASQDLPAVPPIALFQRNGDQLAYVVTSHGDSLKAALRTVTTGVRNGRLVSVARGIAPGERVVVVGQNKLEDGVKLAIHKDMTAEYYTPAGTRG
ncbi:efflux RND transporter periplasmic adaptor subunit [Candidatus Fermentibacteria bacterium]|nr:efflux RND transporter periplasmic adaptor subunit [Candidatus Fermentibacteria bacterium]